MARTQAERQQIGLELVALRRRAGFRTITQLAATDLGVSSKTLGKLERGEVVGEGTLADVRAFLESVIGGPDQSGSADDLTILKSAVADLSRRVEALEEGRGHGDTAPIIRAGESPAGVTVVTEGQQSRSPIGDSRLRGG